MMLIIVLAGTFAALVLFRWARTVALFVAAAAVLWLCLTGTGHAQKQMMVQCTLGTQTAFVTDDYCDALLDVRAWLAKTLNRSTTFQSSQYYTDCAMYAQRRMGGPTWEQHLQLCARLSGDLISPDRRYRGQ